MYLLYFLQIFVELDELDQEQNFFTFNFHVRLQIFATNYRSFVAS